MPETMESATFRSTNVETYKAAATRRGLRLSDWLREAADSALKAEGFSTGSPEQQYALVASGELVTGPRGDQVVTSKPHPISEATMFPGCPAGAAWLPIENRYSAPFDPAQHWLLKPLPLQVEGDVVVRLYPVIVKCQEHA